MKGTLSAVICSKFLRLSFILLLEMVLYCGIMDMIWKILEIVRLRMLDALLDLLEMFAIPFSMICIRSMVLE